MLHFTKYMQTVDLTTCRLLVKSSIVLGYIVTLTRYFFEYFCNHGIRDRPGIAGKRCGAVTFRLSPLFRGIAGTVMSSVKSGR